MLYTSYAESIQIFHHMKNLQKSDLYTLIIHYMMITLITMSSLTTTADLEWIQYKAINMDMGNISLKSTVFWIDSVRNKLSSNRQWIH